MNSHTVQKIRQALEETTLTKTIEPDAYADAAQQFIDEYGTDLHMMLGEDIKNTQPAQQAENKLVNLSATTSTHPASSIRHI